MDKLVREKQLRWSSENFRKLQLAFEDISVIAEYPQSFLAAKRFYSDVIRCIPDDVGREKVMKAVCEFERIVGLRFKNTAEEEILNMPEDFISNVNFEVFLSMRFADAYNSVKPIFEDIILEYTDGEIKENGEHLFGENCN